MREIILAAALAGAALVAMPGEAQAQSWRDQLGRPGDFRCDAYWDRGRDDCDAAWRTRYLRDGQGRGGYGYWSDGYRGYERGYGHGYGYGWPREPHPTHPPTHRRDPERIHWCGRRFRSYDPHTGYYLGYSGRYRFCG